MEVVGKRGKAQKNFTSFSNQAGEFFLNGLKVQAFIHGTTSLLRQSSYCVYAVVEKNKEKPENNWYLQALQIMAETCKYVLSQPDKGVYYLYWSG